MVKDVGKSDKVIKTKDELLKEFLILWDGYWSSSLDGPSFKDLKKALEALRKAK